MAEVIEFEVLSSATNAVVARHPGRNHPGILLQGDTVRGILDDVEELMEEVNSGHLEAARDIAGALQERIIELLTHYEAVLGEEGRELPYPKRVSPLDPERQDHRPEQRRQDRDPADRRPTRPSIIFRDFAGRPITASNQNAAQIVLRSERRPGDPSRSTRRARSSPAGGILREMPGTPESSMPPRREEMAEAADTPAPGARPDAEQAGASTPPDLDQATLLAQVDAPRPAAAVTLSSGRRYELESGEAADRLVIRGRRGEVILRVEVTDRGPDAERIGLNDKPAPAPFPWSRLAGEAGEDGD